MKGRQVSEDEGEGVSVTDNEARHRYEARLDGSVAGFIVYRPRPGALDLVHTEVDPRFEGRGVGSTLVKAALDDLRTRGLKVVATCPFVAGFIDGHPEYADLLLARR